MCFSLSEATHSSGGAQVGKIEDKTCEQIKPQNIFARMKLKGIIHFFQLPFVCLLTSVSFMFAVFSQTHIDLAQNSFFFGGDGIIES